ncbi:uncharacterized protein METZ01_LOCUS343638 [marine metagenome]|uniref:Uncharacterized protein n=1 Tax=marine metagenome TaxID=408172 RepID=A0A382QZ63_9ZZZZ
MIVEKNHLFAVECQVKMSAECPQIGKYCDTEEEAKEWVEEEGWIFSGEGYICLKCNEQILRNISKIKPLINS